jgi:hypothetical protein
MARPQPIILAQVEGTATTQILAAERAYLLTFQGQPCNIRVLSYQFPVGQIKKYKKTSYAHRASAARACRELNELFATTEFAYIEWPPKKD